MIPFLLSAVLVAVGLFIRLKVAESPVFDQARRAAQQRRMPVVEVLRKDSRAVLLAAGSYLSVSALGYIVIVYFLSYATDVLGLGLATVLGLIVGASVAQAVTILYSASLSDRFGRRRVLLGACSALVVCSLTFFPLADTRSLPLIVLAVVVVVAATGVYLGPQPAAFSELFSTGVRYSGASLSLQLGTIFGGAIVPFMATALYGATGSSWSITAYLTGLAVISLLCVLALEETYRRDLTDETEPSAAGESPVAAS